VAAGTVRRPVRAPVDTIAAPPFPKHLPWVNVAMLRMDQQIGRPVLVEFWDFCRPNSLRTLPYLKAWHERYAPDGLRVVSVHSPGFAPSRDEATVREAVARLGIEHPVCIDADLELWSIYDNAGWPSRYLFNREGVLHEFHLGEGGYEETERAIQELLGVEREPLAPLHPEDAPDARIVVPTADQTGAYNGPYEAGTVWAVVDGRGSLTVNGERRTVEHPGAHVLLSHPVSTAGELRVEAGEGVTCLAVCFSPGLAKNEV
jgi:thiol-disulfide isomerase/thioredoxin